MKFLRILLLPATLFLAASAALATPTPVTSSNDPNFGIKDPMTCTGTCVDITSSVFSFTVPSNGTGQVEFLNDSGQTFTSLTLDLFADPNVTLSDVSCTLGAFFQFCNVMQIKPPSNTETEFQFHLFGTQLPHNRHCEQDGDNDRDDKCGGIADGQFFFLTFMSPAGNGGGWIANQSVTVATGPTPEPGTLVLIATGLVPLWSLRRKLFS